MPEIFSLVSKFKPAGDQPAAINSLLDNIDAGVKKQVLLGVTGSGKTFTMASLIARTGLPALVISPNKVLAAQLYAEFKSFFPKNAVEYFISYYDYYQPEAYIPQTDTYIEKDSAINENIDKMRLKATTSLLSRPDTIVVASVSCIYNIGSPDNFSALCLKLETGRKISRTELTAALIQVHYERNEVEFTQGKFRARGASIDVFPPYALNAVRIITDGEKITALHEFNALTGDAIKKLDAVMIYPAKHFVSTQPELSRAAESIKQELALRLAELKSNGKLLEAQRLEQRTRYDLEMLAQAGFCSGIENYSRQLSGLPPGTRPHCLIDYFRLKRDKFLMFVDESHVAIPQLRGMYEGDRARKQTLVDFGFRLPSALDNRPLKFSELEALMPQTVFVSATPGKYELEAGGGKKPVIVEQIIRPTGLVDPPVHVLPSENQIADLTRRIREKAAEGGKTLVLTLTKKTAEDLSAYFLSKGVRARYLHSDIETLERIETINALRKGEFDALVGINLLREGIDIPEVSLIAILGADNEGFLRSETTLIQISGRAARNAGGEVILYADRMTQSMQRALAEMSRRRAKQEEHNRLHKITPQTILKATAELEEFQVQAKREGLKIIGSIDNEPPTKRNLPALLDRLERQMKEAADSLDFETAALLRDRLLELRDMAGIKTGRKPGAPRKKIKGIY